MPALPAGLRNRPSPSAAATTAGLFQNTIGSTSGTKLQATITVSQPVANRSMIHGAASAPRMPQTPAAVSTRPMWTGWKPAWISRRTATKNSALTIRLIRAAHTVSTRKNGRVRMNRRPSSSSWRGGFRGPSTEGADRSARIRPSSTNETANDNASAAKGSQRVTPYNAPPTGPPSNDATCCRAWFCDSAVGRSSSGTTARTAEISAGAKTPAPTPVRSATNSRCGIDRLPSNAAPTSEP